jgi:hypothetical protein
MPSSASSSSSDKSIAVLIKKAMAKLPMSHNTKKSVDEYYKNAMKEIVMKIKATEKAKKDALKAKEKAAKAKVVAKPTKKTKKHVGGDISDVEKERLAKLYDDALADVETNTDRSYVSFKSNIGAIIARLTTINNRENGIIGIENIAKIRTELDKIQTQNVDFNQEQAGSILDLLAAILNKL